MLYFITGSISGLGKGIIAASVAVAEQSVVRSVEMIKCDPYLNVDTENMNPDQHGEVFVTEDGAQTDLDIGTYERFLGRPLSKRNSITGGQVMSEVIAAERAGNFKGETVQHSHLVDLILLKWSDVRADVVVIEIGGSVGEPESQIWLQAIFQARQSFDVKHLHVVDVPWLSNVSEFKTKPAKLSLQQQQHSGLRPDV